MRPLHLALGGALFVVSLCVLAVNMPGTDLGFYRELPPILGEGELLGSDPGNAYGNRTIQQARTTYLTVDYDEVLRQLDASVQGKAGWTVRHYAESSAYYCGDPKPDGIHINVARGKRKLVDARYACPDKEVLDPSGTTVRVMRGSPEPSQMQQLWATVTR